MTSVAVQGQLASWTFDTLTISSGTPAATFGPINANTGSGVLTGVHASSATAWSTPAGNASAKAFSANTWAVGDYFQFQVTTTGLATGKLTVSFDQTGSNTGPKNFDLRYSTSASFTSPTTLLSYTLTNDSWANTGVPKTVSTHTVDTSVQSFAGLSSVYFRVFDTSTTSINNGTVAAGGTDRIDNFSVSFTAVPEPQEYAALFAGGLVAFAMYRRRAGK
jgi:hypothetical protein